MLNSPQLEMELLRDYNFNELGITQLDGTYDSSSEAGDEEQVKEEEEEQGAVGENEFLGIISAEDLKVLQGTEGSSDSGDSGNSDEPDVEEVEEEVRATQKQSGYTYLLNWNEP